MKVLQLTTHIDMGGITNYILSLSSALKNKGIESLVVSSGGDLEDEFKKRGIETRSLNIRTKFEFSPKIFLSVFSLVNMIKGEKIDIIHAHTRVSQVAALLASRMTGVPFITTCHGFFKKRLRKAFDTWGAKVIAISDAVKTHLEKDLGVSGNRISVIYNGVDIERFMKEYSAAEIEDIKRSIGLKKGAIVIGTIGRLSPVKGQAFLLEAVKEISARKKAVEGLIVGNGPEEDNLKRLARELDITDRIHFMRSDKDTPRYLAVMDIFVFPSIREGLGLSLLEAMAKGLPCVASDVGGISDIIRDGETGMLAPVGSVERLTGQIIRLMDDTGLSKRLGQSARDLVREKFSIGTMADKTLALYRDTSQRDVSLN